MQSRRVCRRKSPATLAIALVAFAGLPTGCTSTPAAQPPGESAPRSGVAELRALSAREPASPDRAAMRAPLPPGVPLASVELPAPADAAEAGRRTIPLAGAIAELIERADLGLTPITPSEAPADDIRDEAVSHYTSGLEMLLDDEPAQAITELMKATTLDPGAMEAWVLLGDAHARTGRRASAVAAYKRAIRLGHEDARALWWLGRDALRDARPDEAGAWLARARNALTPNSDPALFFLVHSDLSEVLGERGYTLASRDALVAGIDLPAQFAARTSYHNELAEIYRRRSDSFVRAGDLSSQLGEYESAAEAYQAAGRVPSLDPGAALPRRVFAMMRLGRPATAATLIVDDIAREDSRLDPRHAELATYLAQHTSMGPRLSDAIGEASASVLRQATPMQHARLALVRAAAAPRDGARTLAEALAAAPQSPELASALVGLGAPAGTLAHDLAVAIEASPACLDAVADATLSHGRGVDELIASLTNDPRGGARLLAARLLRATGRPAPALTALADAPASPHVLAERAEIASELGRPDIGEASLAAFEALADTTPHSLPQKSRILRALGRRSEAVANLAPLAQAEASTNDLYLAAGIALDAGDARLAEQHLLRARRADPQDDRIHDSLVALYAPGGTKPDATSFGEAARALRQASPTGRMLRLLSARDMVLRSQFAQAEPILHELTRSDPIDQRALSLLATTYERLVPSDPGRAERGEAYLRDLAAQRPDFPAATVALARVLAARGNAEPAEALLAERYQHWPIEILALAREQIVREAMNDPQRAHRLALERLAGAAPTLNNAASLVELHARAGDGQAAADTLQSRWPKGATPNAEQAQRLRLAISALPFDTKDAGKARGIIALVDACEAIGLPAPPPLLDARLTLACVGYADEPARLYDVALEASKRLPTLGDRAFGRVVQALNTSDRPRRACPFLAELATRTTPFNRDFALLWVQSVVVNGTLDDAKDVVARLSEREHIIEIVSQTTSHEINEKGPITSLKSELAYALASYLVGTGREDVGEPMYRLALELNPKHALAANDLGYQLLEKGERFDESVELLERAYAIDATRSSITDSIGWVRYKQGRLEDAVHAGAKQEGAITLLRRALTLDDGENDASIHDHLGDALWRAGHKDDAKDAWKTAQRLAGARLNEARMNSAGPTQLKRLEAVLRSPQEKAKAVDAGIDPAVAPLAADRAVPPP